MRGFPYKKLSKLDRVPFFKWSAYINHQDEPSKPSESNDFISFETDSILEYFDKRIDAAYDLSSWSQPWVGSRQLSRYGGSSYIEFRDGSHSGQGGQTSREWVVGKAMHQNSQAAVTIYKILSKDRNVDSFQSSYGAIDFVESRCNDMYSFVKSDSLEIVRDNSFTSEGLRSMFYLFGFTEHEATNKLFQHWRDYRSR